MAKRERVHVIACGVLALDIKAVAEGLDIDMTHQYLEGGLHNDPPELRRRLQAAIDDASLGAQCDRIVVGYGVCGRGAVGIHARAIPLVIPRVHDCIALFLGSDAAYRREFSKFPGTYYISAGWHQEKVQPRKKRAPASASAVRISELPMSPKEPPPDLERLSELYGEENARDIVAFKNSWHGNYQRAAFIDTGAGAPSRYADHARAMADEFGWRYERIQGERTLLEKALRAKSTTSETLYVAPHHVTRLDPIEGVLSAAPVWESAIDEDDEGTSIILGDAPDASGQQTRLGLGIDAGGTYTDVAVYDFETDAVLAKGKALTTKWDYTIGVGAALDAVEASLLGSVDLVAISTTLATNAIVEGHGQEVGLLVMPPYGMFDPADIDHSPTVAIEGAMDIDGSELSPIDEEQTRRVAREMVERNSIGAFAVSGFGGAINPVHELAIKAILRDETGLSVTCGHELSGLLDFRTRARTAVLNARIMPRLEKFLNEAQASLRARGVTAPVMVVKGDGSLMSATVANERPIETVLSGPAASVAGARKLTDREDAIVLDMGGTTSDTAMVREGQVAVCDDGARVGGFKTHVRALDMRTAGLGGDSLIRVKERRLIVGPRRVAPIAWLSDEWPEATATIDYLEERVDDYAASAEPMDIVVATGHVDGFQPSEREAILLDALRERPMALAELAERIGAKSWRLLSISRLEEHYVVQRCGPTPTDALHAVGSFDKWNAPAARRFLAIMARLAEVELDAFLDQVMTRVVDGLATELLKKQLDEETDADAMDDCPACQTLLAKMMRDDLGDVSVRARLRRPVIGLGAPAPYFLADAAQRLGAEAILPEHGDVANAIGAITSRVSVTRKARVGPNGRGEYAVSGLPESPAFTRFDEASQHAIDALAALVRDLARESGSGEQRVRIDTNDRVSKSAEGGEIFLERVIRATLNGLPDLARLREL